MIQRTALAIALAGLLSSCSAYHLSRGNAYLEEGNLALAEEEFRAAGDWPSSHLNLAVVMMKQGRLEEARALLEPLARTGPRNPPAIFIDNFALVDSGELARRNLSLVYSDLAAERLQAGDLKESLKLANLALKNDPENLFAKVNKGISLARRGGGRWGLAILAEVAGSPKAESLTVPGAAGERISLKRFAEDQIRRYGPAQ